MSEEKERLLERVARMKALQEAAKRPIPEEVKEDEEESE